MGKVKIIIFGNDKFTRNILIALGLQAPWYIKEIIFNKDTLQLDIYLRFKKGTKFLAEDEQKYTAHDTVERK